MIKYVKVNEIVDENFQDYKRASMYLAFPKCDFKCFRELGLPIEMCQNFETSKKKSKEIEITDIYKRYETNLITRAIVLGGLEPFLSYDEVFNLISYFRKNSCNDDFVIYTGYYPLELDIKIKELKRFKNIIIKFGRYIPNSLSRYDDVLGVTLASNNQFALKIS